MFVRKVAVLFGGISSEREISIATAKNVIQALEELNYKIYPVELNEDISEIIRALKELNPDVVFNALHGGSGENGEIQAALNMLHIPYTHSGVLASSIGMNKIFTHYIADSFDIQMPKFLVTTVEELRNIDIENTVFKKYPIIVKKHNDGSTVGMKILHNDEEKRNFEWNWKDESILVEEFIKGREFTVGVLNGSPLCITEICCALEIFSYEAKYNTGMAKHVHSPQLPTNIKTLMLQIAMDFYNILCCNGVARLDFMYDEQNDELYLLEINTQPGLTPSSFIPEQAVHIGLTLHQVVQCLIEQATSGN